MRSVRNVHNLVEEKSAFGAYENDANPLMHNTKLIRYLNLNECKGTDNITNIFFNDL